MQQEDTYRPSKVRFSGIEVLEFPSTIGDNPSVSTGVPLALAAEHETRTQVTVDEYEMSRGPRMVLMQLLLDEMQREKRLRSRGYERDEIAQAIRLVERCRLDRYNSFLAMPWDSFHEKLEKTSRKLKKIVGLRKSTNILSYPTEQRQQAAKATCAGKSSMAAAAATKRHRGTAARVAPADE